MMMSGGVITTQVLHQSKPVHLHVVVWSAMTAGEMLTPQVEGHYAHLVKTESPYPQGKMVGKSVWHKSAENERSNKSNNEN